MSYSNWEQNFFDTIAKEFGSRTDTPASIGTWMASIQNYWRAWRGRSSKQRSSVRNGEGQRRDGLACIMQGQHEAVRLRIRWEKRNGNQN